MTVSPRSLNSPPQRSGIDRDAASSYEVSWRHLRFLQWTTAQKSLINGTVCGSERRRRGRRLHLWVDAQLSSSYNRGCRQRKQGHERENKICQTEPSGFMLLDHRRVEESWSAVAVETETSRKHPAAPHLALQHSAEPRAAQLLQRLCCWSVQGLRQQEAQTARRQAAQTEHGEGHGGMEGPLRHTQTHNQDLLLSERFSPCVYTVSELLTHTDQKVGPRVRSKHKSRANCLKRSLIMSCWGIK